MTEKTAIEILLSFISVLITVNIFMYNGVRIGVGKISNKIAEIETRNREWQDHIAKQSVINKDRDGQFDDVDKEIEKIHSKFEKQNELNNIFSESIKSLKSAHYRCHGESI